MLHCLIYVAPSKYLDKVAARIGIVARKTISASVVDKAPLMEKTEISVIGFQRRIFFKFCEENRW